MSNGNRKCAQSKSQQCPGGLPYNTSGRPLTIADINAYPGNVENVDETTFYDTYGNITASDFSESNTSNSITPPVVGGQQFNLQQEIQRSGNIAFRRLVNENSSAPCNRTPSPLRDHRTSQQCPNSKVTKNVKSRDQEIDTKKEFHCAKSSTCLQQNCRNVRAGDPLDLDRLYDYNIQAQAPPAASGRSLDVQRELLFRGLNLPTPKGKSATPCPTPMRYSPTVPKPVQRQTQTCPQTVSSACPNSSHSTSQGNATSAHGASVSPSRLYQKSQGSPRSITKTVTTTIARTTSPPRSPPKSTLGRSPTRSLVRSPDRPPGQNNTTRQDITELIDLPCKHTPPRGFATPPAYKTPQYQSNMTQSQFASPSFQRPDNSNVPQTPAGNHIFNAPLSESTRHHDTINLSIPPRPDTITNYTILPEVATPSNSFQRQEILNEMSETYRQTPQRGFTTPPANKTPAAYKTPPSFILPTQHSKKTTQLSRPSLQIPDNSTISYVAQTPHSEATLQYESINMQAPPRPNTMTNETTIPRIATSTPPSRPAAASCTISRNNKFAAIEQSRCQLFSSADPNRSNQQMSEECFSDLSSCDDMNQNYGQTPSRTLPSTKQRSPGCHLLNKCQDTDSYYELQAYLREYATAKRCGRVQFDSSDKFRVQDPNHSALRKIQIAHLVDDTYCPGIIQDTIDGQKDFNDHSFDIILQRTDATAICDGPPKEEPMTLLEAFSIRIEKERSQIEKQLSEDATEEQIKATIQTHFGNQNRSDLNSSIESLLLSERIQEHEQVEQIKEKPFEADIQKLITTFPDNLKIKVYFYAGRTKLADENPTT